MKDLPPESEASLFSADRVSGKCGGTGVLELDPRNSEIHQRSGFFRP